MKILVLNGSPKKEQSDTMHVTRAFLAGMQEAGRQYAAQGTIDAGLSAQIGSPMIPEEKYAAIANGEA